MFAGSQPMENPLHGVKPQGRLLLFLTGQLLQPLLHHREAPDLPHWGFQTEPWLRKERMEMGSRSLAGEEEEDGCLRGTKEPAHSTFLPLLGSAGRAAGSEQHGCVFQLS